MDNLEELKSSITLKDIVGKIPVNEEFQVSEDLLTPNISFKLKKLESCETFQETQYKSDDINKWINKMPIKTKENEPVVTLVTKPVFKGDMNQHLGDASDDQLFRLGDTIECVKNCERRISVETKCMKIKDSDQIRCLYCGMRFEGENNLKSHYCDAEDEWKAMKKESEMTCCEDLLTDNGTRSSEFRTRTSELPFDASKQEHSYTFIKEEIKSEEVIFQPSLIKSEIVSSEVDQYTKNETNSFYGDVGQARISWNEFYGLKNFSNMNGSSLNDAQRSFGGDVMQEEECVVQTNKNINLTDTFLPPSVEIFANKCVADHSDDFKKKKKGRNTSKQEVFPQPIQSINDIQINSNVKKFFCHQCDKSYCHFSKLVIHNRTHTGDQPFTCGICNKSFSRSIHLTVHKRTHTGEKPFTCDICNMSFAQRIHLKVHKRMHTGEKPFTCDICNKSFSYSSSMTLHKKIHSGERTFTCDICNKRFFQCVHLKVHKRTHTGAKPFMCDICNKTFSYPSSLNRHRRKHTVL